VFSVDATPIVSVQGNPSIGTVILNGVAPSGGAVVSLSTDNGAAAVPATVTVDAGQTAGVFGVSTFAVSQPTPVTITASFGGVSRSTSVTVSSFTFATTTPTLMDLSVSPATVTAGTRSIGRVRVASPAPDPSNPVTIALSSSNEAAVVVARNVTVGYGGTFQDFRIRTFAVAQPTQVTPHGIFQRGDALATLTVNPSGSAPPPPPPPPPPPASVTLSALSLNPTSVVGGNSSAGTVTLSAAAPAGGAAVSLSDNSPAASTPASVTVPAGSTTASFTITTSAVSTSTPVTNLAAFGRCHADGRAHRHSVESARDAHRDGDRPQRRACGLESFGHQRGRWQHGIRIVCRGTRLTLTATNGRVVIWSGACSSGGDDTKSCTFTLNGNASVSANVQ